MHIIIHVSVKVNHLVLIGATGVVKQMNVLFALVVNEFEDV